MFKNKKAQIFFLPIETRPKEYSKTRNIKLLKVKLKIFIPCQKKVMKMKALK
jgi:hypothetical protein